MLIQKSDAREKVLEYLARLAGGQEYELAILETQTREEDFGWVFFYNTRQFIETGDLNWALGGNAPIIVDKHTGDLHLTGTAFPLDAYLVHYRLHGTCEGTGRNG